jgi:cbb3-type cytochrome oxidase subunit 3
MKIFRTVYSPILLILFGWAMIAFYKASIDIAEFFKNTKRGFMFELNLVPFIAFLCIGGFLTFITYRTKKKNNKALAKALLLPDEFEENDEREKQITAQACRSAYISMWYSFPFLTALLLLYPFVSEKVPYYPIIVILLFPLTQSITYLISWKKNY